ncbi:MAG: hypothetical protein GY815_12000 [Gammaproteobacteria bacterium]|nr:hypothetical protein [Gammaproteobacteria bacterium]
MKSLTVFLLLLSSASLAGEVRIVDVRVECPGSCTFAVTLEHADQGWSHYANQWDVMTLDDKLLGSRVLHHPHDDEQPFTRSLSGVTVPQGVSQVKVRARDKLHGYSSQEFLVDIPG